MKALILGLTGKAQFIAVTIALIWAVIEKPPTAFGASPKYFIYDLGSVPGASGGTAYGINRNKQVTGWTSYGYLAYISAGTPRAFIYSSGTMQDIGAAYHGTTSPSGINDAGDITGSASSGGVSRASRFSSGVLQTLGTLGGTASIGSAINNFGWIVGQADIADGHHHAFLYKNNSLQDIGTLGGTDSSATGINSTGQISGSSSNSSGRNRAFLYSNGGMQDIGSLGGASGESYANAINELGNIVGETDSIQTNETTRRNAFVYTGSMMTDLGSLPL